MHRFLLLLLLAAPAFGDEKPPAPYVHLYAEEARPFVQIVQVAVTSTDRASAILVRSLEIDGQLPTTRYFHHGVYGSLSKREDGTYRHHTMAQQLTPPVATSLLLPGQSARWTQPIRIRPGAYTVRIRWHATPRRALAERAWVDAGQDGRSTDRTWRPFVPSSFAAYRNRTTGLGLPPRVYVTGKLPVASETSLKVGCTVRDRDGFEEEKVEGFPVGSVRASLVPIAETVVISGDRVTLLGKDRKPLAGPRIEAPAMDLILHTIDGRDGTPCILDGKTFGDIVKIRAPHTRMYYNPGIVRLPRAKLAAVLERARERKLAVRVQRIDPNGLGRRNVIVIGAKIDGEGRPIKNKKDDK